jgi:2-oxo-4-hydroxy-4-carboxy-5-ureidoimidazoline decarboxylase
MTQHALDDLNAMDQRAFVAAVGDVFEHAPWVAEAAYAAQPFSTLAALNEAMTVAIRTAGAERNFALIKGHPDLAGKAARSGTLTVDSMAEQASAGLDRLSEDEFARFHELNGAYRAKFGMPFIVCVRRHGKDSIFRQFERRLQNDHQAERDTALTEVLRIGALRLAQRISAPDQLKVDGRLSTHVLDTHRGRPAVGVAIGLFEVATSGEAHLIAHNVTNADGRTDCPLISGRPIPIAQYELRFAVGDYFARQGTEVCDPPFLGIVPIRFTVAEPEGYHHVPLLVTPWSYTTYRGS